MRGVFIIDKEIEKINNRLQIIEKISSKSEDERTQLEKDLLTAIFWFGSGIKESHKSMRFIKFVMALEALLIPDGITAKKQTIAKRFTTIFYCEGSDLQKKKRS